MPSLKQLTCDIEWANVPLPFKECGTVYGDGVVESYVAIPDFPTPFAIRLQSHGYIAPGLAMFVFIDGVYQCNRNRDNLRQPDDIDSSGQKSSEVTFRVRQKEEQLPDGSWVGKPWRFEPLQIVSEDAKQLGKDCPSLDNLGTIHVFVLRCLGSRMGSDGTHTPDSGMEAFYDFEELGNEMSTLRLSALSPIQFAKPFFTSFDGPCDASRKFVANPRSVRRHHSHGHSAERIARHSTSTCPHRVGNQTDSESYSESPDDICTCSYCQEKETDTTSCSSIRPCIQKRAFSAYEKRMPANTCRENKSPRARRHTHQSHDGLPTIPIIREEKPLGHRHRHELDDNIGSNLLHGRRHHFSPVRDDSSSICTSSSDEIKSRRRRSRKPKPTRSASCSCSVDTHHCHDKPQASLACQRPSEYITGNRVVVPPIVLHLNPPTCLGNTSGRLVAESPSRKTRSASSGCYIIRNGRRVLQNKGWCLASSESSDEESNQDLPELTRHSDTSDGGCLEAHPANCVAPACVLKKEKAWLSWIKGTGIQHDGNSGSVKKVKINGTTLPNTNAAVAPANQSIPIATAQKPTQGQSVQPGVAVANVDYNVSKPGAKQAINNDWNQVTNDINTAAQITNEWSNPQDSWNNQAQSDGQLQQQATSWGKLNSNGTNQAAIETSWGNTGANDANGQPTSWDNKNTSNGPAETVAAEWGNNNEWDTNGDNNTTNGGRHNDSWDVNCPGKWTEGTSEWSNSGVEASKPAATQVPVQSTQNSAKWHDAHSEGNKPENIAKREQNAQSKNSPVSKSCSPADTSSGVSPLNAVPASVAESRALSHQVQPGQESFYAHRIKKPKYIDSLDKPYAKFVFHYRKREVIEKKFGVHLAPNAAEERMKLEKLPKAEILERLLKAEGLVDGKAPADGAAQPNASSHTCRVQLPSNANEGIPSSPVSVIHFGSSAAPSNTQKTTAAGAPEQVSWNFQQATGNQGFLQTVNNKLQTHVEDTHGSRQIDNEWNVVSEPAVTAW